jgi:hypothetical protein
LIEAAVAANYSAGLISALRRPIRAVKIALVTRKALLGCSFNRLYEAAHNAQRPHLSLSGEPIHTKSAS